MLEVLMQRWRAMAPRERRMVAGAAALLALAVLYLLLIEPAWLGRERAQRELPVLRTQLARVASLADEATRLAAAPASALTPQAVRARLEASIDSAGLADAMTGLQHSGSLFDVRFDSVSYADWLAWLDDVVRDVRLRVVDAAVTREAAPGRVDARVSFEMAGQAGR